MKKITETAIETIDRAILSDEEIAEYQEKADTLAKQKAISKVHPVVQIDPESLDRHVCYLTEPNYSTKIRVMDKATTLGVYTAADELRQACLIKEASDAITYGDSPECDRYKLGVTDYALTMVTRLQNQFKKKIEQYEVSNSSNDGERMNAFIRCVLRIDPDTLDEDEWHKAWGQVQFYLGIIHQVKFS